MKTINFTDLKKIISDNTIMQTILTDDECAIGYQCELALNVLNAIEKYINCDLEKNSLTPLHPYEEKVFDLDTLHKMAFDDADRIKSALPKHCSVAYAKAFLVALGDNVCMAINGIFNNDDGWKKLNDTDSVHSITINNYGYCHDLFINFDSDTCDMWIADNTTKQAIKNADFLYSINNITYDELKAKIAESPAPAESAPADNKPASEKTEWVYTWEELKSSALMDLFKLQSKFLGVELNFEFLTKNCEIAADIDELNFVERDGWGNLANEEITSFRVQSYGALDYIYFSKQTNGTWSISQFDVVNSFKTDDGKSQKADNAIGVLDGVTIPMLLKLDLHNVTEW